MLNQQGIYINLTCNCRVSVGVVFLCLLCACLPSHATLESIDQQHFAKTKLRYISLPPNLNAIIGITSHYRVILKMVILHDATKTIQNGVSVFFFSEWGFPKHPDLKRNEKKQVGWGFKKNSDFPRTWSSFNTFFCDFPRSGTSHINISLIGCAPHA